MSRWQRRARGARERGGGGELRPETGDLRDVESCGRHETLRLCRPNAAFHRRPPRAALSHGEPPSWRRENGGTSDRRRATGAADVRQALPTCDRRCRHATSASRKVVMSPRTSPVACRASPSHWQLATFPHRKGSLVNYGNPSIHFYNLIILCKLFSYGTK